MDICVSRSKGLLLSKLPSSSILNFFLKIDLLPRVNLAKTLKFVKNLISFEFKFLTKIELLPLVNPDKTSKIDKKLTRPILYLILTLVAKIDLLPKS